MQFSQDFGLIPYALYKYHISKLPGALFGALLRFLYPEGCSLGCASGLAFAAVVTSRPRYAATRTTMPAYPLAKGVTPDENQRLGIDGRKKTRQSLVRSRVY
ncbi:hypothetical protein PpBr36_02192 [Pyricularia pennisetigena]|uniref:hypothetical protein n=1 Tax=Pyricularia pennisetigena TaxID=1578925 RepID=UPI0011511EC7|nr:hypothetical protein PpBr36_02192 [Pyricularia pennisetigena]TLS31130.1 hypothetical protein PpBr36_02192 [Pyricularia pennisetigena]